MLNTSAKRQVAAELRAERQRQSSPTGRWIVCPASLAPGVDPHAVRVLRLNRHYAYCGTCELQFGLHGPLWEGSGPLTLSEEDAAAWLTRLKQLKSPPILEVPPNELYPNMGLPDGAAGEPSGNAGFNDHR